MSYEFIRESVAVNEALNIFEPGDCCFLSYFVVTYLVIVLLQSEVIALIKVHTEIICNRIHRGKNISCVRI